MKKTGLLLKLTGLAVLGSLAFADGTSNTIQMPQVDWTNFNAGAALVLSIVAGVMLFRRLKGSFH